MTSDTTREVAGQPATHPAVSHCEPSWLPGVVVDVGYDEADEHGRQDFALYDGATGHPVPAYVDRAEIRRWVRTALGIIRGRATNVLSLFSGIGGLDLGLERAGMTVVGQVEIDSYCRRVLAHADGVRCGQRPGGVGRLGTEPSHRIGWTPEPCVDRVADGVPSGVDRRRALGNAVVPQVAERIGRLVMASQVAGVES